MIGLQNGINIPHLGDKMLPPCVSPDKIDDETEVNVGGVTKETVINDSIFSQTALYRTSKPLIEHLQKSIHELMLIGYGGSIHSEKKWGQKRTEQFISHVFIRIKTLFEIPTAVPTSGLDTIMVDSAVNYLSSLQVSGTNFTANEYLRTHILESLVSSEVSNRILATRLGVNRKLLPDIIERRRTYDAIANLKRESDGRSDEAEDDSSLDRSSEAFESGLGPDELGLCHLFADFGIDPDDDFFFNPEDRPVEEETKRYKSTNVFQKHFSMKKRKQRKDCPKYVEIVRTFLHSTFRPDTFAKRKIMIKNEDGTYEHHLPHIQNSSVKEAHNSFMESEIYHDWQYQNRWVKKCLDGDEIEILPSICLRLFYYAICPCCKCPIQRDCADSLVVGFSHLLTGLGKIRSSELNNKKESILACVCPFHFKDGNKDIWKSANDFMLCMLCPPREFTEFQNPEISKHSLKVHNMAHMIT